MGLRRLSSPSIWKAHLKELAKGKLGEQHGEFALPRYAYFREYVLKRGSQVFLGDADLSRRSPGRQPGADQRRHSRFGWGESEQLLHQRGQRYAQCIKR